MMKKITVFVLSFIIALSLLGYGATAFASDELSENDAVTVAAEEGSTGEINSEEQQEEIKVPETEAVEEDTQEQAGSDQEQTTAQTEEATAAPAEPQKDNEQTETVGSDATTTKNESANILANNINVNTKTEDSAQNVTVTKPKTVKLTIPELKNCVSANDGVKISWKAVEGAESYVLYRWNASKKKWVKLADAEKTSYIDKTAKAGKKYYYSVAAKAGNKTSKYDNDGKIGVFLKATKLTIKRGSDNTAKLSWKKVEGAAGYRIYWRNAGDTKWTAYKWVDGTSFSDKISTYGKSYEYLVRAYHSYSGVNYMGYYNDSYTAGFTLMSKPVLKTAKSAEKGVTLTWDKTKAAKKYNIYLWDTAKKKYKKIATSNKTSYVDKTAKAGKGAYYTVTAIDKYGNEGQYNYDGIIGAYVPGVKVTKITNEAEAIKIDWQESKYAAGYRLYWRNPGGSWKAYKDFDKGTTSFKDTPGTSGETYDYMVKPYIKFAGKKLFGFANNSYTKRILRLNAPSVSVVFADNNTFKASWKAVAGAKKYRVFRKEKGGSWKQLAEITATNYTDKKVSEGVDYYYTVRAVNGNYIGSYKSSKKINIPTDYDLPAKRYLDLGWEVDPRNSWGPADYCKNTSKVDTKYWTYHNTFKGDTYKPKAGDIITYGVPDSSGTTQGHVDICVKSYDPATGTFGVVTGNWGGTGYFTTSGIYYVNKTWSKFTKDKTYYRTICNIWECKLPEAKRDALVRTAYGMQSAYEDNPDAIRNKILSCKYNNWCDVFVAYVIYVAK